MIDPEHGSSNDELFVNDILREPFSNDALLQGLEEAAEHASSGGDGLAKVEDGLRAASTGLLGLLTSKGVAEASILQSMLDNSSPADSSQQPNLWDITRELKEDESDERYLLSDVARAVGTVSALYMLRVFKGQAPEDVLKLVHTQLETIDLPDEIRQAFDEIIDDLSE